MKSAEKYSDCSEQQLILAAQQGDACAFKELYDRYHIRIHNLIFYMLGNPFFAEDVLQTTFLKTYRNLSSFRLEAAFSTWLYRITLNECRLKLKPGPLKYMPIETILGSGEEIDVNSSPDGSYDLNETQKILKQALLDLSPKLRAVVVLKYLEDLSYNEIAEVLDCSPGTVASRLNRALTELEVRLRPLKGLL